MRESNSLRPAVASRARHFDQEVPVLRVPHFLAASLLTAAPLGAQTQAPVPRDTLDAATYEGWKQYSLACARCHGEEAQGTSFGPNLLVSLRPDGSVPTREAFVALLLTGRPDKGMGSAETLGLAPEHIDQVHAYLSGRSEGRFHGGRPARRGT